MLNKWFIALLAGAVAPLGAQVYVSETGNDDAPGSADSPFRTLERAIASQSNEIFVSSGEFILPNSLTIPSGVTVTGGLTPNSEEGEIVWRETTTPTLFLLETISGQVGIILDSDDSPSTPGAALKNVTILGGFVGVEMRDNTLLENVIFEGGTGQGSRQLAFILVDKGQFELPSQIIRCQLFNGNTGVRMDQTGSVLLRDTLIDNPAGRGLFAGGDGSLEIDNCVIQGAGSDGIGINSLTDALVRNSVIRKSGGAGIDISASDARILGNILERNEFGVQMRNSESPELRHNTIIANRTDGVFHDLSYPNLFFNIIASNGSAGVRERGDREVTPGPTPTPPTPTPLPPLAVGGAFEGNFLWNNAEGQYVDNGGTFLNDTAALSNISNSVPPLNNQVIDPLFMNEPQSDFRLQSDSPAVDIAPPPADLSVDADGNPRIAQIPGAGNESGATVDAGALETAGNFLTNFGAFGFDSSFASTAEDGSPLYTKTSSFWTFDPTAIAPYNGSTAHFLPGMMRIFSEANQAIGIVRPLFEDLFQPQDSIAQIDVDVSVTEGISARSVRLRAGGWINHIMVLEPGGLLQETPTRVRLLSDMRQGAFLDIPAPGSETYQQFLFLDFIGFRPLPIQSKAQISRVEATFQNRAVFEQQFNEIAASYQFESGIDGWVFGTISDFNPANGFYDTGRRGLAIRQFASDTFGAWASPPINLNSGEPYKITARISSDSADFESNQGFRIRMSAADFSVTQELVVDITVREPNVYPTPDGREYVIYGVVPPGLRVSDWVVYFDIWGFGAAKTATIYLEEIEVLTP